MDIGWQRRLFHDGSQTPPGAEQHLLDVAERGTGTEQLTDFQGRRGLLVATALATDGRRLFFAWGEPMGNVWTADVGSASSR